MATMTRKHKKRAYFATNRVDVELHHRCGQDRNTGKYEPIRKGWEGKFLTVSLPTAKTDSFLFFMKFCTPEPPDPPPPTGKTFQDVQKARFVEVCATFLPTCN